MIATGQSETAVREYEIFEEIRGKVMEESYRIQQSAAIVSLIDALAAFASVSRVKITSNRDSTTVKPSKFETGDTYRRAESSLRRIHSQ